MLIWKNIRDTQFAKERKLQSNMDYVESLTSGCRNKRKSLFHIYQ